MLQAIKIFTTDLEVGMFVSALDRPWLETPFMIQGFRITDHQQIDKLRKYCEYVLVDTQQSKMGASALQSKVRTERPRQSIEKIFPGRPLEGYNDRSDFSEEQHLAHTALDSLLTDIVDIFEEVDRGGKVKVIELRKSVEPLVDSVSRNPDACLWITRLKEHDNYTYKHSLGASIWAVSLGRQLGLPRQDLRSLAMGGMLMDVGKLRIDPNLLRADRSLSDEETEDMRMHVQYGIEIIEESGVINPDVYSMVAHHHERHNGSGYPLGLKGDDIPAVARIAGIVDSYDAMTSDRSHAPALSPSEAIKVLYQARDVEFQAELVEAFIQAIGIYPAGTIVELSTGEVGVVLADYRSRRLHPKVLVLRDAEKNPVVHPQALDLQQEPNGSQADVIDIRRAHKPGAFGIDLSDPEIQNFAPSV